MYTRYAKQLDQFHVSCFHCLLHIRWQDGIPSLVLRSAGISSIHTRLLRSQDRWGWTCPCLTVACRSSWSMEKCLDKHTVGGQKQRRYKDNLTPTLKDLALDRPSWHNTHTQGVHAAEVRRVRAKCKTGMPLPLLSPHTSPTPPSDSYTWGRLPGPDGLPQAPPNPSPLTLDP